VLYAKPLDEFFGILELFDKGDSRDTWKKKNLVGLDIGSSSIKMVSLRERGKGKGFELLNFGIKPLPREAIVGGTIMDASAVIFAIQELIQESNLKEQNVATSVDGASVIIQKINMTAMSDAELNEAIRWEAGQYIPFDIEEVRLDHEILEQDPTTGNLKVLLVAAKRDLVNEYTSILAQAGLNTFAVDIDSFCVQNAYEINYPTNASEITALVNIGASTTNVCMVKGTVPLFWRDLQWGGDNFTEGIQRELTLNFEQAEAAKEGKEDSGIKMEQVIPIINQMNQEFGIELKKTLDFFKLTTNEGAVQKIVLSGEALKFQPRQIPCTTVRGSVEVMNPFQNIDVSESNFSVDTVNALAPMFAVSVGLALRKVGE